MFSGALDSGHVKLLETGMGALMFFGAPGGGVLDHWKPRVLCSVLNRGLALYHAASTGYLNIKNSQWHWKLEL